MNNRAIATAVLAAVFALAACASDDARTGAPTSQATSPAPSPSVPAQHLEPPNVNDELLFIARADTGLLSSNDTLTQIVLRDVDTMTWFSDRPKHDAGVSTAVDALAAFGWTGNGATLGVPANAALVATELGDDTAIIELLDASFIDGALVLRINFEGKPATDTELTNIQLFIDSAGAGSIPRAVGDALGSGERMSGTGECACWVVSSPLQPANAVYGSDGQTYWINSYTVPGTSVRMGEGVSFTPGPAPSPGGYLQASDVTVTNPLPNIPGLFG